MEAGAAEKRERKRERERRERGMIFWKAGEDEDKKTTKKKEHSLLATALSTQAWKRKKTDEHVERLHDGEGYSWGLRRWRSGSQKYKVTNYDKCVENPARRWELRFLRFTEMVDDSCRKDGFSPFYSVQRLNFCVSFHTVAPVAQAAHSPGRSASDTHLSLQGRPKQSQGWRSDMHKAWLRGLWFPLIHYACKRVGGYGLWILLSEICRFGPVPPTRRKALCPFFFFVWMRWCTGASFGFSNAMGRKTDIHVCGSWQNAQTIPFIY